MPKSFELINVGKFEDIKDKQYILPDSKKVLEGKVFLNELMDLTGSEISLNSFAPGQYFPFDHKHKKNEELFIILKGEGEFEIDGKKMDIKEGSIIKVNPNEVRNICNTSKDTNMLYIVIQTIENSMNSKKPTEDGISVVERTKW
ncbi:cupin domain-containing protein [Halarcobacter anaerophilus]|uniref:cupin domain-containing protein n=1 Tax=Halarcobacter anaerophilus TaxID=877500 RepID=UPI0005CA790E|nr:cupin domain-containing protein [Halarcobacter anaerophilus]